MTAEEVRELRLSRGMTSEEFASFIGVSLSTIQRWETGKSKPKGLYLRRLTETARAMNPPPLKGVTGVGIDLVRIARFEEKLENTRFLERLFTPRELRRVGKGVFLASRLAARWATKEATAKSLGCGLGPELGWREVEVVHDNNGKPLIILTPDAAERHNFPSFHLTISHEGKYAVAVVIASKKTE